MRIVNLPTYFYGDEAEYASVARSLMHDPRALAYPDLEHFGPAPFVSQPPLMLYLFALGGRLFGDFETGALLVNVFLGTATVLLVYLLGLEVRGRAVATVAALLLALAPAHVSVSRTLLLDAGLTFFTALSLLGFLRWTRTRRLPWALVTGIAAGCALLSKLYGLLVLPALAIGLAWELLRPPVASDPAAHRRLVVRHASWAAVPAVVLVAAYLGLLWHLRATANLFEKLGWQFGRVAGTEAGSTVGQPWHSYFTDPRIGLPDQIGLLVLLLAPLGLVALLLRHPRRPAGAGVAAVLAWPACILLFFGWSSRQEWFYIQPVLPAVCLLAGMALTPTALRLGKAAQKAFQPWRRASAAGIAGAFLVLAAPMAQPLGGTLDDVLLEPSHYGAGVREAALFIHARDPDAGQVGTLLGRFALHFYNGHTTYHLYVNHTLVEDAIRDGSVDYVVIDTYLRLPSERAWLEGLVTTFNGTRVESFGGSSLEARVHLYELHP